MSRSTANQQRSASPRCRAWSSILCTRTSPLQAALSVTARAGDVLAVRNVDRDGHATGLDLVVIAGTVGTTRNPSVTGKIGSGPSKPSATPHKQAW